jgi:hypothetical protein
MSDVQKLMIREVSLWIGLLGTLSPSSEEYGPVMEIGITSGRHFLRLGNFHCVMCSMKPEIVLT